MCGIVGIAGNMSTRHNDIFRDMLLLNVVRGADSTGIMQIELGSDKPPIISKALGHPLNLLKEEKGVFTPKGKIDGVRKVLLGHNRAATSGEVNVDNAHPIQVDHIIGVHNGTIHYTRDLVDGNTDDLDSRALYKTIAAKGIDEAWKSFYGAAALVWWDSKEQTLNLIRNEERPLWVGWGLRRDVIYWASEPWMITVALNRNNESLNELEVEGKKSHEIIQLKAHALHTFAPTSLTCPLKEVRELQKKSFQVTTISGPTMNGRTGHLKGGSPTNTSLLRPRHRGATLSARAYDYNWTEGTERAPKDWVGEEFTVQYRVNYPVGHMYHGKNRQHFIGKTLKPPFTFLEIYPSNAIEESQLFEAYQKSDLLMVKLNSRPRIGSDQTGRNVLRISASNISLLPEEKDEQSSGKIDPTLPLLQKSDNVMFLPTPEDKKEEKPEGFVFLKGGLVSRLRFREILREATGDECCSACGNPITPEDADDIEWVGVKGCLCSFCKTNSEIRQALRNAIGEN